MISKSLFILVSFELFFGYPAKAQTFDELANQFRSYDVQCQNSKTNCWARDQVGEKLSSMGAYLCGRRDWYATPEQASAAGCR
jgi:hypothetical protein